jgi:hypothetical protein
MHQDHNIPWVTLASHLEYIRENPHISPRRTDLFPMIKPSQTKDQAYFVKAMTKTICQFSATERAKYPSTFPAPTEGTLFSDELLNRDQSSTITGRQPLLSTMRQRIENWIQPPGLTHIAEADVIMALLLDDADKIETLLMLANHPQISLARSHHLKGNPLWNHEDGWRAVAMYAAIAYVFFNVIAAKPELLGGAKYKTLQSYRSVLMELISFADGDGAKRPHREFFGSRELWDTLSCCSYPRPAMENSVMYDPFDEPDRQHEYLKKCFQIAISLRHACTRVWRGARLGV